MSSALPLDAAQQQAGVTEADPVDRVPRHDPTYQYFNSSSCHISPQPAHPFVPPPTHRPLSVSTSFFHRFRPENSFALPEPDNSGISDTQKLSKRPDLDLDLEFRTPVRVVRVPVSSLRNLVSDRSLRSTLHRGELTASIPPYIDSATRTNTHPPSTESARVVDDPHSHTLSHPITHFVCLPPYSGSIKLKSVRL